MSDDYKEVEDETLPYEVTEETKTSGPDKGDKEKRCADCGRTEKEAGKLIQVGNDTYICPECMQKGFNTVQNGQIDFSKMFENLPHMTLDLSNLGGFMMPGMQAQEEPEEEISFSMEDVPAPHKIKEMLDRYVIGQEQAKKVMAVAVYNHYKRVSEADRQKLRDKDAKKDKNGRRIPVPGEPERVEIQKSNILLIGPTGSGKTYLVETLARLLDVPMALTDATSLTEAGYIGDDIESVVSKLLANAGNNVAKAEHGIIFIDEIDKIAKKKNTNSRDVSGEAVQQGLLKLLEGAEIEVPVGASSKNAMVPLKKVNTKNILFICGGAFPALDGIIRERLTKENSIGFHSELRDRYEEDPNILLKATAEDIRNFGMIPEFLGRLPILCALEALTEDMLVRILREPKNAILKQYEELLRLDSVKLTFEEDALRAIASRALEKKTGARALRTVIEEFMLDIMYEIPKDKNIGEVIITKDYVEHKGGPRILMRGADLYLPVTE